MKNDNGHGEKNLETLRRELRNMEVNRKNFVEESNNVSIVMTRSISNILNLNHSRHYALMYLFVQTIHLKLKDSEKTTTDN